MRLDHQPLAVGNDLHDRRAGLDHAALGMSRKSMDAAELRRPHDDPPQLVGERLALLVRLRLLRLDLPQLVHDVLGEVLLALHDLQLGLRDDALAARDVGDEAAHVSFHPRLLALQAAKPLLVGETLLEQRQHVAQLLAGKLELPPPRLELGLLAGDLGLRLLEPLFQHGDLTLMARIAAPRTAPSAWR